VAAGFKIWGYLISLVVRLSISLPVQLVAAIVMGKRHGFPQTAMPPHNLTMTVAGAGMLWVGWFGFNAGSAIAANGDAGMAMMVTHISAAAGAMAWMFAEWIKYGLSIMENTTAKFSNRYS
jgi:ammonia channel protein AmtB